jgi:branched-subunit amino acid transport protein AzlD
VPQATPQLTGIVHLAVVLAGAVASLFLLRFDAELALSIAAGATFYVVLLVLYRAYRITGDALNGLSLSMIVMLLLYPFHAVMMRDSPMALNLLGSERYEYFTYALLVVIPGVWLMYRGFRSGRPGPISRAVERYSRVIDDHSPTVEKKLVLLVVIGVAARISQVALGTGTYVDLGGDASPGGSSAHFVLDVLSSTTLLVALYLLATGAKHGIRRRTVIGGLLILTDSVWGGFFSGSRYLLFLPLLSAAAVYSATVKPVTLRRLAVIMTLFMMVAFPLATAYKNAYLSRIVELQRQGLSTSAVLDSIESTSTTDVTGSWTDLLAQRFHAATSLALVIRYTPERHAYMWGQPYLLLPTDIAIPRIIWPDKPVIRQFTLDFRFDYFKLERGTRTAIKPSQFGELWANLNILGVLLGAWVWGRILRFMYSFLFLGGRGSLFGKAAYATAVPALISVMETEQVTGMAFIAKSLVVWLAWTWFLGARRGIGRTDAPSETI